MKKRLFLSIVAIVMSSLSLPSFAADLMEVFQQAACADPVYRAAYSKMLSTQEALPQSVAGLLPNISANANDSGNYVNVFSITGLPPNLTPEQAIAAGLGVSKFNSQQYTVNLSQTIINFTNWMQVAQASNIYKQAAATFAAALQDLIIRVATAYFNVLQAQDNLNYTLAQKAANWRELDQTKQRYQVGLDNITSVYNAQAAYDAILAQVIAAQNTLENNQEALRQLTGIYYPNIESLKIELPLIKPLPLDVDQWVAASEHYNQPLVAAEYAARAAQALIKANFGGHLPTVSAVGSYSRFKGTSFGTTNLAEGIIGLQLNVPVFQGGLVNSQVRQAEDDYATASANVQNAYLQASVTTRQNFNNVLSGISKVEADRAAIVSAQSSVDSTEESFKVGTRTIVDVLLAQQQLFQANTNYATDEYAYLLSTLQLKQSAGTLCPRDLCQINAWLHGPKQTETWKRQYQQQENSLLPIERSSSSLEIEQEKTPLPLEKKLPHPQTKAEKHQQLAEQKKAQPSAAQKKHQHFAEEKKSQLSANQKKHQNLAVEKKLQHPAADQMKHKQLAEAKKPHSLTEKKKSNVVS